MDRPAKRQRIDWADGFLSEDEYDYIPDHDLEEEHRSNVIAVRNKLKTRFEDIFLKYERDFTDIGDEVDLQTGEVIVNNGHLYRMRNEQDVDGCSDVSNLIPFGQSRALSPSASGDELNDDLQRTTHPDRTPLEGKLSISQCPPQDLRWAAPEIPGLSHGFLDPKEVNISQSLTYKSPKRSISPDVSLWEIPQQPCSKERSKPRLEWTMAELDLLCRLKNADREWKITEIQEMLPHRSISAIQVMWRRIEKNSNPASYININVRRKAERAKKGPLSWPRTPFDDDRVEDLYETETDELVQARPAIVSKNTLRTTPQHHTVSLPSPIKQEPPAAISPSIRRIANANEAPASSSPITNALGWLRRSTAMDDLAIDPTESPTGRHGAYHHPAPKTSYRSMASSSLLLLKRERARKMVSSQSSRSSPSPNTLLGAQKIVSPKMASRTIPDSDDPVMSSQSDRIKQHQKMVPDVQDCRGSSRDRVSPGVATDIHKQATPVQRLPSKTSYSTGRKKTASITMRSSKADKHDHSRSPRRSLSFLQQSSDDEQDQFPRMTSSPALYKTDIVNRPGKIISATEKRPQCGRDGFSCGRVICLRCA